MAYKIAIPTDDGVTISRHFGRARAFLVVTIENGEVIHQELRELPDTGDHSHHHHDHDHDHDHHHDHHHGMGGNPAHMAKFEYVRDCQYLIGGGMGAPAMNRLNAMGIQVALTDHRQIADLLEEVKTGQVRHNPRRVHHH
jgi:predicted Fe-Mo cluster-binding NifX family protein